MNISSVTKKQTDCENFIGVKHLEKFTNVFDEHLVSYTHESSYIQRRNLTPTLPKISLTLKESV
jgi:hypothetical protein